MNYRKGFIDAVNNLDDRLFKARGLHINAAQPNINNKYKIVVTLTAGDGTKIAYIQTDMRGMGTVNQYPPSLDLAYGWTEEGFRRNITKPRSGPGYGTILRALVCKAAKDAGLLGVTQTASAVTNRDKVNAAAAVNARRKINAGATNNNLKRKAAWRPVSAYIMNRLGFNENKNRWNHIYGYEERLLWFKRPDANNVLRNSPTPKLNATINEIFS